MILSTTDVLKILATKPAHIMFDFTPGAYVLMHDDGRAYHFTSGPLSGTVTVDQAMVDDLTAASFIERTGDGGEIYRVTQDGIRQVERGG